MEINVSDKNLGQNLYLAHFLEEELEEPSYDIVKELLTIKDLYVKIRWEDFSTLVAHPTITCLWRTYCNVKFTEEHPYSKDIIKGKFRFLSINWEVIDA